MKVGDLVKRRRDPSILSRAPSKYMSKEKQPTVNEPGIVIEMAENACKVIFPSLGGNIRSFLKSSLETIS